MLRAMLAVLVLPAALLVSVRCADDGGDPAGLDGSDGVTRVSVLLTDAPDDLAHAWVEIERIYLQGGGDEGEGDEAEDDGAAGRVILLDEPTGLVDLLTLDDAVLELVDDVVVPSKRYSQLRVIVGGAVVETESGEVFSSGAAHPEGKEATGTVLCPSCVQTGIKVVLGGEGLLVEGDAMIVMIDFDAGETFGRRAGESGMWVMRPVITASEVETGS